MTVLALLHLRQLLCETADYAEGLGLADIAGALWEADVALCDLSAHERADAPVVTGGLVAAGS